MLGATTSEKESATGDRGLELGDGLSTRIQVLELAWWLEYLCCYSLPPACSLFRSPKIPSPLCFFPTSLRSPALSLVFFFLSTLVAFLATPKIQTPSLFSTLSLIFLVFSAAPYLFSVSLIPQASTYSLLPPWQVTSLPHVHAALYLKKPAPHSWKWNAQLTPGVGEKKLWLLEGFTISFKKKNDFVKLKYHINK